ncbi:hypothetical protein ACIPY1_17905 [Paenarthrobacter nicotinovorans]|uniref:hypothetical protein n=1 Tax=Paenarthrobacter nicotinovorans TaxID=29320 RepID=UPI003805A24B
MDARGELCVAWRDGHRPAIAYQQIIDRISSDKALHELLQPLLDEVRQLQAEISELREVLGGGTASKYLTIPGWRGCLEFALRRAGAMPAMGSGRH